MFRKPRDKPYPGGEVILRKLLFLSATAVFAAALVLTISYQVQAGGQNGAQKPPIIRTTTRIINVSVVVTDREGQPVEGLTKDDFQILDNGHPEKVAFFSTVEERGASIGAARSLAPGEYSNDAHIAGTADKGTTIILFDTLHTHYLSQAYSLRGIRIFLRQLQPEDHIGIYVLNMDGLKIVYRPDQPAAALLEAIQRYDDAHSHSSGEDRKAAVAAEAAAENSTGLAELDRFLKGKDDRQPQPPCRGQIEVSTAALEEIARSMVGLGGRKTVIWVSEDMGLPLEEKNALDIARWRFCGIYDYSDLLLEEPQNLSPRPTAVRSQHAEHLGSNSNAPTQNGLAPGAQRDRGLSENDEMDLLLRLVIQSGIAFYPVSAEGLQTLRIFGPGGAAMPPAQAGRLPPSTEGFINALDSASNVVSHQTMEDVARRTGGRAFYNRNDLETGIRRALNDSKYSYELAYYPDNIRWNADWRKIQVKVNRPDVSVLARSGYYSFSAAQLLPPKARKQLLEEIAASPLEDTEIPITVKVTPPASATASTIEARVFLSAQKLFTNDGDGWKSDFEVLLFQLTLENKILDVTTEPVSLDLTEAKYTDALKEGIDTLAELQLKPGAAILYVIVHDKRTDAVGSVRIPLDQYAVTLN
ncbi:MAG TPA: VWA domain-containing protein [Candidatus Acidoferrales bacterium]|nr:VWA domain-containing protein [Candidatus Acidoferrales bacterium]